MQITYNLDVIKAVSVKSNHSISNHTVILMTFTSLILQKNQQRRSFKYFKSHTKTDLNIIHINVKVDYFNNSNL